MLVAVPVTTLTSGPTAPATRTVPSTVFQSASQVSASTSTMKTVPRTSPTEELVRTLYGEAESTILDTRFMVFPAT